MSVRPEVCVLVDLGALPSSSASPDTVRAHEEALRAISVPVTNEEARVLVRLFGSDDCFGLAWSLLHLIETAPGWPIMKLLASGQGEWISRLRQRAENAGYGRDA